MSQQPNEDTRKVKQHENVAKGHKSQRDMEDVEDQTIN
jgi:hypothetical protein